MKTKTARTSALAVALLAIAPPSTSILAAEYQDLAHVVSAIVNTANASGNDASASTLKDSLGTEIQTEGVTRRGTPIWSLTITKSQGNPRWTGSRKILVTGTQHAREWVAYRAVLDAAQF